jgi:uncharacterized membrane protein YqiK
LSLDKVKRTRGWNKSKNEFFDRFHKDLVAFGRQVQNALADDLSNMGLQIDSFIIKEVSSNTLNNT